MADAEELQRRLLEANDKLRRQETVVALGGVVLMGIKFLSGIAVFGGLFAIYQNVTRGDSLESIVGNVIFVAVCAFICWKTIQLEDKAFSEKSAPDSDA